MRELSIAFHFSSVIFFDPVLPIIWPLATALQWKCRLSKSTWKADAKSACEDREWDANYFSVIRDQSAYADTEWNANYFSATHTQSAICGWRFEVASRLIIGWKFPFAWLMLRRRSPVHQSYRGYKINTTHSCSRKSDRLSLVLAPPLTRFFGEGLRRDETRKVKRGTFAPLRRSIFYIGR